MNAPVSDDQIAEFVPADTCAKCDYDLAGADPAGACPECGTPIVNGCIWCGYDLSGTDPESTCPECGVPVVHSVGRSALAPVPTELLRSVHAGFKLVTVLILVLIVTTVAMFVTMIAFAGLFAGNTSLYITTVAMAIVSNGLTLGILYGWFKLSKPLTGLPQQLDAPDKRRFLRATLWALTALTAISVVLALFPDPDPFDPNPSIRPVDIVAGVVQVAGLLAMLAGFVAMVLYVGWFARLVRNGKMYRRSKHLVWSGPLIAILGFPILFLGPLITLVLYWNMVEYVRRDLKKVIGARTLG